MNRKTPVSENTEGQALGASNVPLWQPSNDYLGPAAVALPSRPNKQRQPDSPGIRTLLSGNNQRLASDG